MILDWGDLFIRNCASNLETNNMNKGSIYFSELEKPNRHSH